MNASQIRTILTVTEVVVEELAKTAELLSTSPTKDQKLAFIRQEAGHGIEAMLAAQGVDSSGIEGVLIKRGLDFVLGFVIDRVAALK